MNKLIRFLIDDLKSEDLWQRVWEMNRIKWDGKWSDSKRPVTKEDFWPIVFGLLGAFIVILIGIFIMPYVLDAIRGVLY